MLLKLESIRALIEAAHAEVSALCKGKQWRMCIPVHPADSDAVIGGALRKMEKLLAVVEASEERISGAIDMGVNPDYFESFHKALAALEADT